MAGTGSKNNIANRGRKTHQPDLCLVISHHGPTRKMRRRWVVVPGIVERMSKVQGGR